MPAKRPPAAASPIKPTPTQGAPAPVRELQPRGNADAAAAVKAREGRAGSEHTIFVDGTWQNSSLEGDYWGDGAEQAAHELLGSESGEEFDWYDGPNDARARQMAGRRLYHKAVLPALERDQSVNFVTHSHGGNVVGELGEYMDDRRDYVGQMSDAAQGQGIGGAVDKFFALGTVACATTIILSCSATTILACWSEGDQSASRRPREAPGWMALVSHASAFLPAEGRKSTDKSIK